MVEKLPQNRNFLGGAGPSIISRLSFLVLKAYLGFPGGSNGQESACQPMQEMWVASLSWEDPLE